MRQLAQSNLRHGSSISASSVFNAGSVDLFAGGMIKLSGQSSITVSSLAANGGDIHISTPDVLYLLNSEIDATAGRSGGNFALNAQFVVLNGSSINTAAGVAGGSQNLNFEFLFEDNSLLTATGVIVATGTVDLDLGSQLITLPTSLLSAENQLQERCTALLRGDFSSFISIGRGGTEPEPEELQEEF